MAYAAKPNNINKAEVAGILSILPYYIPVLLFTENLHTTEWETNSKVT